MGHRKTDGTAGDDFITGLVGSNDIWGCAMSPSQAGCCLVRIPAGQKGTLGPRERRIVLTIRERHQE
jgi:hypothetical protein